MRCRHWCILKSPAALWVLLAANGEAMSKVRQSFHPGILLKLLPLNILFITDKLSPVEKSTLSLAPLSCFTIALSYPLYPRNTAVSTCSNELRLLGVCIKLVIIVSDDKYARKVSFSILIYRIEGFVDLQT